MVELLDDLCDAMDHYTWGYVMPNDGEGGTLKAGWVLKNKAGDISFEMSKSEESIRQKSLKSFCGKVIEEYEEELIEALRTGFDEDAGGILLRAGWPFVLTTIAATSTRFIVVNLSQNQRLTVTAVC